MKTKLLFLLALFFSQMVIGQVVSTLAGSSPGFLDALGISAQFNNPWGMVTDSSGNVYVADELNHKIRKITPAGDVSTFAGTIQGYQDGDGGSAKFYRPNGLAIDSSGNIYVVDCYNHKIRKITPSGYVTTFAGSIQGFANGNGTAARFQFPQGIAIDSNGNLFVVDSSNDVIRKITSTGDVTTFAGGVGIQGFVDGTGTAARFNIIKAIAINTANDDMYVTDGHRIRKITSGAVVTSYAGATTNGLVNGTAANARFTWPEGVAVDANGVVYVVDTINCVLRKITTAGMVSTFVGNTSGIAGSADGTGTAASFYAPKGICFDTVGNIYIADTHYSKIRKIDMASLSSTNYANGKFNFNVFPNPVSDVLTIEMDTPLKVVEIYDLQGQKILASNSKTINVSNLVKGLYMVVVKDDIGGADSQKLCIN